MSLLAKAKGHYTNILAKEPLKIEVPEWDATVYAKPSIPLAKLGEIMELANSGKSAEAMVMTLIYRLMDEEGNPVFRKAERNEIMRQVDPDVISRIVTQMSEDNVTEDDIVKN